MLVAVAGCAGTAAAIDLKTRRIPNALTAATAALGIGLAAFGISGVSVGASLAGLALGFALMMPGRLLGATGGGDVKLMAAMGAIIGIQRMPVAFVATAIAGGVLAVLIALGRGRFAETLGGTGRILRAPAATRDHLLAAGSRNRFAYGPAIAVGSVLAAWLGR